jgi:hypothetical protein
MSGKLVCGHVATEIVEGCMYRDVAKKYEIAILRKK